MNDVLRVMFLRSAGLSLLGVQIFLVVSVHRCLAPMNLDETVGGIVGSAQQWHRNLPRSLDVCSASGIAGFHAQRSSRTFSSLAAIMTQSGHLPIVESSRLFFIGAWHQ